MLVAEPRKDPHGRRSGSSSVYAPETLRRATATTSRSWRRSRSASTSTRTRTCFAWSAGCTTTLELACGRCLEPFSCRSMRPFDLRYQPRAANAGEGEQEVRRRRFRRPRSTTTTTIDLGQLMREQFYLALPMKPLCRRTAAGLCRAVRHEPEHGDVRLCQTRWEDPRLAALRRCEANAQNTDRPPDEPAFATRRRTQPTRHERRRCRIQNDDTPRRGRPSAGRTMR